MIIEPLQLMSNENLRFEQCLLCLAISKIAAELEHHSQAILEFPGSFVSVELGNLVTEYVHSRATDYKPPGWNGLDETIPPLVGDVAQIVAGISASNVVFYTENRELGRKLFVFLLQTEGYVPDEDSPLFTNWSRAFLKVDPNNQPAPAYVELFNNFAEAFHYNAFQTAELIYQPVIDWALTQSGFLGFQDRSRIDLN